MAPSFSAQLREALVEFGVAPRRVREDPEEWRLGPMTLALDRARDRATLRYARQPVAVGVACDADAVARAYRRVAARLQAGSLAPDELFAALERAYAARLEERGAAAGARVSLVELAAALAAARKGYTRAQLAFDLVRLVREGGAARGGRRLDLGIATGAATSKKSRVLWIEDQAGSGHYYETLRFVPDRRVGGAPPDEEQP